jgi:hypothetical protein
MRTIVLALLFAACKPPSTNTSDLRMSVKRAAQSSQLTGAASDPQTFFVSVDLYLINDSDVAAPLGAIFFTLTTKDGLEIYGDPSTAYHPRGCPQDASLAAHTARSCVTVFRVAHDAVPDELHYQRGDGHNAIADVKAFFRCEKCGDGCVDVSGDDPANCGACGATVGLGSCVNGAPSCNKGASVCGMSCVDLKTDPDNCGFCGTKIGAGMTCVGGKRTCAQPNQVMCPDQCVATDDVALCGGCTPCPGTCDCSSGRCQCKVTTTDNDCSAVCKGLLRTCGGDDAAHYLCSDQQRGEGHDPCDQAVTTSYVRSANGATCNLESLDCTCI